MKKMIFCAMAMCAVAACHQGAKGSAAGADQASVAGQPMAMDSAEQAAATFKKNVYSLVDYKKDPACGMPLTAGLEDTTRYKGKLYGFCSKECMNEFLKNPEGYSAKAK